MDYTHLILQADDWRIMFKARLFTGKHPSSPMLTDKVKSNHNFTVDTQKKEFPFSTPRVQPFRGVIHPAAEHTFLFPPVASSATESSECGHVNTQSGVPCTFGFNGAALFLGISPTNMIKVLFKLKPEQRNFVFFLHNTQVGCCVTAASQTCRMQNDVSELITKHSSVYYKM